MKTTLTKEFLGRIKVWVLRVDGVFVRSYHKKKKAVKAKKDLEKKLTSEK